MIVCFAWNRVSKTIQSLDATALEQHPERLSNPDEVIWIDLANPSEEEEQLVLRKIKPIHTLTLEDMTYLRRHPKTGPHFPKVEEFPDYLFVIVNPLTRDYRRHLQEGGEHGTHESYFTQLSAVMTANALITHHYEALDCIDQVTGFLERHHS